MDEADMRADAEFQEFQHANEVDKLNAEILALHRQLAAEKLRADQGWQRYENANAQLQGMRSRLAKACDYAMAQQRELNAKQAKIDALMLEYCPNEMTPEQIEEWGKHQRRVDIDLKSLISPG